MTTSDNETKLAQFSEFFTIEHEFSVNTTLIGKHTSLDYQTFINNMPLPFQMASDMSALDQAALRPLQAINGIAGQLVEYLNHQAKKIDLLMGYILNQQIEEDNHYQGISFGGGGISFTRDIAFNIADHIELKLFFHRDNFAIYCYGEVIEVYKENDIFTHKIIFHFIRDEDRETLVRASLHKQSEQLKLLAAKRKQTQ